LPDDFVLVYPGNVHAANVDDVDALYTAVSRMRKSGSRIRLLRIGDDSVPIEAATRGLEDGWLRFSSVADRHIPDYVGAANALVQPGRSDLYNDYRFPSKIPMFFASGRPVVLHDTNLGSSLKDGENCLLLQEGDPNDIAVQLGRLVSDEELCRRVGRCGRKVAYERFSWKKSAVDLLAFYRRVLDEDE